MTARDGIGRFVKSSKRGLPGTLLAFLGASTVAEAQPPCLFTQVTDTVGANSSERLALSGGGNHLALQSRRDLTGLNPDGNAEIFLYDHLNGSLTQITDSTAGSNSRPSVSAEGRRIVWASNADPLGLNSDGNFEVFLYDTRSSGLSQITDSTGGSTREAVIDGAGGRIAFISNRDPLMLNPDGNAEIFVYETGSAALTQITETTGGLLTDLEINFGGTRLVFRSDLDLTGGNPGGSLQAFLFDLPSTVTTQLPVAGAEFPALGGGTRVAFESSSDPIGNNADGNVEIFLYDRFEDVTIQVTDTTGGDSFAPDVSRGGTRVAFESDRDPAGDNADGNFEIFFYDSLDQSFTQVTNTTGGINAQIQVSRAGSHIAFRSNRDLAGGNADGNFEIFLGDCSPPAAATLEYDPNLGTLPSAQRWQHFADDPLPLDGVDESNYTVASGVLVQGDTGGISADRFNRQLYHRALDVPFDLTTDRVDVSAEVQILHSTLSTGPLPGNRRAGFGIQVTDARGVTAWLYLGSSGLFLLGENDGWTGLIPFDTDGDFHLYELRLDQSGVSLAIDGVRTASLDRAQLRVLSSGFSSMLLGDLTIGERSSAAVRSFRVSVQRFFVFADGFETGNLSAWSSVTP